MKRLDAILLKSFEEKASDIHLSYGSPFYIRRFGSLLTLDIQDLYSPDETDKILLEILNENQKATLAQKEDLDFSYEIPGKLRCRGNIFRQIRGGLDASFRLIPFNIPERESLGLPDIVDHFIDLNQGLVLITGPAGSGKTTTLAVIVDAINNKYNKNIIMIENPIEYIFTNQKSVIHQREVNIHTASFGKALKAASREDPDVIVVGELRDTETVAMALKSAETGNLVIGTLHTKDAPSTVNRVIDVFPPEEQPQIRTILAENLKGILSQVLIPRLDKQGMALACEILVNNPALSNMIREDKTFNIPSIVQTGKKQGMITMRESIQNLIQSETVSEDALNQILEKKEEL